MKTFYNSNAASCITEEDLQKEKVLTQEEKEFEILLERYINGIKIYTMSNKEKK